MTRVLVTGAGGFIGAAVTAKLADQFEVVAGLRRRRPAFPDGVASVASDLENPAEIAAALRGVDLVVHAAYGDAGALPRQLDHLLAAMSAAGVRSLLHFSSIAVYGRREGDILEADEGLPPFDAYAAAKRACERRLRDWCAGAGERRVIALRPGIVYGAGSALWIDKMLARIAADAWGLFGRRGEGFAALIHVDDLARLTLAACQRLADAGREGLDTFVALNAIGPELVSWNGYFAALFAARDAAPETWDWSKILRRRLLAGPAKLLRRLGWDLLPKAALAPSSSEWALFALKARHSGDKAAKLLNFTPEIGLREGLSRSGVAPHASR